MGLYKTIKIEQCAGSRAWFGLAALALPTLLLSIDTSVLYVSLPRLSIDLKANSMQQLWIMDIYGFMIAGFLITMGNLGDRIGYRKLLIIGSTAFGFASIMAAFSTSSNMLIAARAIMGIAGATLMPSTLALIRNMFVNPKQRGTAISIWMSCFMAGMIVGPLISGLLLEHFWWGAVFLLGLPVMLLVIFVGPIVLPEYCHGNARPLDIKGAILSLAAVLPFIYGFTELSTNNLQSIPILAIILSLIFGFAFVHRERSTDNSLLDLRLFTNIIFSATLIAMLLTAVIMGGIALFMAQYLQMVMGLSPLQAGIWMIPQAIGMIIGSMVVSVIAKRIRPVYIMTTGLLIAMIGMLLLSHVPGMKGLPLLETGFVTAVIGVSPVLVLGTGIIIGSAPPEKAGAAASISETCNQLGIALGVAFLGSIGSSVYHKMVLKNINCDLPISACNDLRESLVGATSAVSNIDGQNSASLLVSAKNAFVAGFHTVSIVSAVIFALLACLTAVCLRKVGTVSE